MTPEEAAEAMIIVQAFAMDLRPASSAQIIHATCGHLAFASPSSIQAHQTLGIALICTNCTSVESAMATGPVGLLPGAPEEISEDTGLPPEAVQDRLTRAARRIHDMLNDKDTP